MTAPGRRGAKEEARGSAAHPEVGEQVPSSMPQRAFDLPLGSVNRPAGSRRRVFGSSSGSSRGGEVPFECSPRSCWRASPRMRAPPGLLWGSFRRVRRPFRGRNCSRAGRKDCQSYWAFLLVRGVPVEILLLGLQKGFVRVLAGPQNELAEVPFFDFRLRLAVGDDLGGPIPVMNWGSRARRSPSRRSLSPHRVSFTARSRFGVGPGAGEKLVGDLMPP